MADLLIRSHLIGSRYGTTAFIRTNAVDLGRVIARHHVGYVVDAGGVRRTSAQRAAERAYKFAGVNKAATGSCTPRQLTTAQCSLTAKESPTC
jgi:hypothetical protein